MKKIFYAFLFICCYNSAAGNCTRFLGGDRVVMPCSDPFTINYADLFSGVDPLLLGATFQSTQLFPSDTIRNPNGTDTVIFYMAKTKVVATATNGCKDSAIVRVLNRRYALPNLGADRTVVLQRNENTTDITRLYSTFGYTNVTYSSPSPVTAGPGVYTLRVSTGDGCEDSAIIDVRCPRIPDDTLFKCANSTFDLTALFPSPVYQNTWNTNNPSQVNSGVYRLISTNNHNGCVDTAFITIKDTANPSLGPDKSVKLCPGYTLNLYGVFFTGGLTTAWNTTSPSFANVGNYTLIVTSEFGCKDTANVSVTAATKPNLGADVEESICANEGLNLPALFNLANLTPYWSTPTPDFAPPGNYRLVAANADGCRDTANIKVLAFQKPAFLKDTVIKLCGADSIDLTKVFPLSSFTVDYGTPNPTKADTGVYPITVTDMNGCSYTDTIWVEPAFPNNEILNLCRYTMGPVAAFTSNQFKSVTVSDTLIWASATNGGLYSYQRSGNGCNQGVWRKHTNTMTAGHTYKDLVATNAPGDRGVWAASQGHSAPYHINGGVDYTATITSTIRHYGTFTESGGLSSRNGNSIAVGANGRIYVALGQSLQKTASFDTTLEGGIFELNPATDTAFKPLMINLPISDIRVSSAGRVGDEVWFGVDRSCSSGCSSPYIVKWNTTTNSPGGFVSHNNSTIPFDSLGNTLIVRAIFQASNGRVWVGLNSGFGFAVMEPADTNQTAAWMLVTQEFSPLPASAAVNANAITEVNGEIWMGTTAGLLVYDGVGSLTDCSSYKLYTTRNGLPVNNVTDVAYDTSSLQVWFTTDAGIYRIGVDSTVSGTVYDVTCGKFDNLRPTIGRIPLKNVSIILHTVSDSLIGTFNTDSLGRFNAAGGTPNTLYKLTVKHGNKFTYVYDSIKFNQFIGDIFIPDSLIKEIIPFKDTLKEKTFTFQPPVELASGITGPLTFKRDGFFLTNFDSAYRAILFTTVKDHHRLRVENLADYYLTLATIYNIGLSATQLASDAALLATEVITTAIEMAEAIKGLKDFSDQVSVVNNPMQFFDGALNGQLAEVNKKAGIAAIKLLKSKVFEAISGAIKPNLTPEGQVAFDLTMATVGQVIDQIVLSFENTTGDPGIANLSAADFKKQLVRIGLNAMGTMLTSQFYTRYCRVRHKNLIKELGIDCKYHRSPVRYQDAFIKNYNTLDPDEGRPASQYKQALDMVEETENTITLAKDLSGVLQLGASATDIVAQFALGTFFLAEIAPLFKTMSVILSGVNLFDLTSAMAYSLKRAYDAAALSDSVVNNSGFPPVSNARSYGNRAHAIYSTTTLTDSKNKLNQRLAVFRAQLHTGFDTLMVIQKFDSVRVADSAYDSELRSALTMLRTHRDSASTAIPNFNNLFRITIDSFVLKQNNLRSSFFTESAMYFVDSNKQRWVGSLDTLINKMRVLNEGTVDGVVDLITKINNSSLQTPAFLVLEKTAVNFTYQPDSSGTITYHFKNYGNVPQQNVNFKISPPSGGFVITSADSINVGTINPGVTKSIAFNFKAPSVDTSGSYTIQVSANNGYYIDVNDVFFTQKRDVHRVASVRPGAWSNPATWATNKVPTELSNVVINHRVHVDIPTAVCRTIRASGGGLLNVREGMKLTIKK